MSSDRSGLRRILAGFSLGLSLLSGSFAWSQDGDDPADRKVIDRFLTVLEKNPRRGTALDRVYGYHVEQGSLDGLVKRYDDRTRADPKDGSAWMLLGLVEAQRGHDAQAVAAFRQAEQFRPDDPLAPYYLGQVLVLVGQPEAAVEAFERSLARKPTRVDLLEIFQTLGRVHQRARRTEKALAVWARLEAIFPDDNRVREQIAVALAEEDQPALALAKYEILARDVKDDFRKIQFTIEAADLKIRLGRSAEALADYEKLLARLDPASWLFKDVRRKVENVFLRGDDLSGLAKYYETWIGKTPDDVDAMARLGKTYAELDRAADARIWLDRAVKLAPTRRDLRLALIEQLIAEKKFADAAAEYAALARAEPGNPDLIRDWGRLLLRDSSKPEAVRKAEAGAIWNRLAGADVKDSVSIARAADLFRSADMVDEAIALYQRAITCAMDPTTYRESLGEYYHQLKRPADALNTWCGAPTRTAAEKGRLGEVLAGFGYRNEALELLSEAVKLAPTDFELRLKLADLLMGLDRPLDAIGELARAVPLADAPERVEEVLTREINAYQVSKTLGQQIAAIRTELEAGQGVTADRWTRLARLYEADGKSNEATLAASRATVADPRSRLAWSTLARLQEGSGNLGGAVESNRTLASLDRRNRADYLSSIARLEARLGRKAEALKAGRELLAAAPGNIERHEEFAELCLGLGEIDEGLDALRRAARANPSDPKASNTLADALARQFRTEEAIEVYWRCFERTRDLDGRLGVVSRLVEQYLVRNQFDRLIARLERELREPDRKRELALCLAHAYQGAGDLETARERLESILAANPRDSALLTEIANLAETEGDLPASARYLKQAVEIAPSPEALTRLANLYVQTGEIDEAEAIWSKLATSDQDSARVFATIDSLLAAGKGETVLTLTERLLRERSDDWDALYREGLALINLDRPLEAAQRFQRILDLKASDDQLATLAQVRKRNGGTGPRASGSPVSSGMETYPLYQRRLAVYPIRAACKLDFQRVATSATVWTPFDFGQARMAALGWLLSSVKDKNPEAWVKARQLEAEKPGADARLLWDLYYLQLVRSIPREFFAASVRLARACPDDPAAQFAFLFGIVNRDSSSVPGVSTVALPVATRPSESRSPLPADEQALMLRAVEVLRSRHPELLVDGLLSTVFDELKRAGREAEATALFTQACDEAKTIEAVGSTMSLAARQGDLERLSTLIEKYDRLAQTSNTARPTDFNNSPLATAVSVAMGSLAESKNQLAILKLLDQILALASKPDSLARRLKNRGQAAPGVLRNVFAIRTTASTSVRNVNLDFPVPNPYFDYTSICVLRNAYEIFKRDDLAGELIDHFRDQATKASDDQARLFPILATSYLLWWNDEKDEALQEYTRAAEITHHDVELTLSLAELRAQRGELAEALAATDSIDPLDQKSIQRREMLALRLAIQGGDIDRARKAAERLFNLRLDAENQVQLAALMNQIGLKELADSLQARNQKRGTDNSAQVALMLQRQGKTDQAIQIAGQILRWTSGSRTLTRGTVSGTNANARATAIQVLAESGKIPELITQAEEQLKTSPKSQQLLQNLAEYYQVTGQSQKAYATYERLTKLRPDEARSLFQFGTGLINSENPAVGLDFLRKALQKEPTLILTQYPSLMQAFQRNAMQEDLAGLLASVDLQVFAGNPAILQYLIQSVFQSTNRRENSKTQAVRFFRKACNAMPESRIQFLGILRDPDLWKLPEIYDEVKLALIPAADRPIANVWMGLDQYSQVNSGEAVTTMARRLGDASVALGKLKELESEVVVALQRSPEWTGGKVLLATLKKRDGKLDEARTLLEPLTMRGVSIPLQARMAIAEECESVESFRDIALKILENALTENIDEIKNSSYAFLDHGPGYRLALLYRKVGRIEDARNLALKYAVASPAENMSNNANLGNVDYLAYLKLMQAVKAADLLRELNFPADAARLYCEILSDTRSIDDARIYSRTTPQLFIQINQSLDQAFRSMTQSTFKPTLNTILGPKADVKLGEPRLDLGLILYPSDLDKLAVACVFTESIKGLKNDKNLAVEPAETVERLVAANPDDLSILVASALLAINQSQEVALVAALDRLSRWVDAHPLDPLPASGQISARQRQEARRQLILWLVAREAVKFDASRSLGEKLGLRASQVAARQLDHRWSLAILRETGSAALARSDRAAAESAWRAMGQLIINPTGSARTSPLTLERFGQVVQIARLASNENLSGVSIDMIRQALAGGPPFRPIPSNTGNNTIVMPRRANPSLTNSAEIQVEMDLFALERSWTAAGADRLAIYQALREAVLPTARPNEIFLYNRAASTVTTIQSRSVAGMLARYAIKAGKANDLKAELEARGKSPFAASMAKLLLDQIEFERDKAEGSAKHRDQDQ